MIMPISKRIFLHITMMIIMLCDSSRVLAASATRSDNFVTATSQKHQKLPDAESFVEYFKDHEISEKQARENLRSMRESDFATPAHCRKCSVEHQRYCYSDNLLKDHCCCNQSHNKEQLYFIPHTCFINEDRCYPSLGSCLTVTEIRNCCCDAQLKKHWKSLLSDAHSTSRSSKYLSLLLALLVAVYGH